MEQILLSWAPQRRNFTVSELAGEMRVLLANEFTDIFVSGEISGVKLAASGHYYFTLKDETAQLRCVCYKMTARYLRFKPQDGAAVLARGRVDLYDARGELQLIVDSLEPQGLGALQHAFEQLKKKLALEGLFDAARKKPLPALPERIGIVTSPTGAVIRDILHVLERRCPGRHIRIYPTPVQGEGAAEQIAEGIGYFATSGWAEVIIVARGGGSLEDLWAFNEEVVARVIAASDVPVISAVGHETDFTIADFVADMRAPTPSAAAELVIATRQSLTDNLHACEHKLKQSVRLTLAVAARHFHRVEVEPANLRHLIGRRTQRVDELDYRIRDTMRARLQQSKRVLDDSAMRLARKDVRLRFAEARRKADALGEAMRQRMRLRLRDARGELGPLSAHLQQLSPLKILDRGYAIVERDGTVVKSPQDAPVDSTVRVRVAKGEFRARVVEP
ncbi:MAG: exodeoxyribonuclease VII large subunit [Acidobacteriota bacterium]